MLRKLVSVSDPVSCKCSGSWCSRTGWSPQQGGVGDYWLLRQSLGDAVGWAGGFQCLGWKQLCDSINRILISNSDCVWPASKWLNCNGGLLKFFLLRLRNVVVFRISFTEIWSLNLVSFEPNKAQQTGKVTGSKPNSVVTWPDLAKLPRRARRFRGEMNLALITVEAVNPRRGPQIKLAEVRVLCLPQRGFNRLVRHGVDSDAKAGHNGASESLILGAGSTCELHVAAHILELKLQPYNYKPSLVLCGGSFFAACNAIEWNFRDPAAPVS